MRDVFGGPTTVAHAVVLTPEELAEADVCRRGLRGLGPLVRVLRVDLGMSQAAVATRMEWVVDVLDTVERGEARPNVETVRRLAVALDAPFLQLFDVWDEETPGAEDRMTVAEARAMVRRVLREGVECPCCGKLAKEQRRTLTPPMVRFLVWLVDEYRGAPIGIADWIKATGQAGGDYAKIEHWGLARREPGKAPRWSPTIKGREFVAGQVKVHKICVLWRNEVIRWEGKLMEFSQLAGSNDHPQRTNEPAPTLPGMGRA